jgi:hypothetical protein
MCYGNILSTAMVKIRKERQCFGCEQRFPAGTTLERTAEAEDGTINNFYLCPTCRDYLREHLRGATRFNWNGLLCEIKPSRYDIERATARKAIDGFGVPPSEEPKP